MCSALTRVMGNKIEVVIHETTATMTGKGIELLHVNGETIAQFFDGNLITQGKLVTEYASEDTITVKAA